MLEHIKLEDVLFLDVETVPEFSDFQQLDENARVLWKLKCASLCKDGQTPESVYEKSSIYAEFGKIVCISAGFIYHLPGGEYAFRVKSCFGDDEKVLLSDFSETLKRFSAQHSEMRLCAHNGKEFDFPYLCRRMLINGISIPDILNVSGKRPWETRFLDTLELWKFGDYKHYTSLDLLAAIFGIPSPKENVDGSMIYELYWQQKDYQRIKDYCEKDVLTVVQLFLRYQGKELLQDEQIVFL